VSRVTSCRDFGPINWTYTSCSHCRSDRRTPVMENPRPPSLHALQAVVARGASIFASFLLTVAVARLLGATAGGTFFLVFTSLAVLGTLARFGTDNLALVLFGRAGNGLRRDVVRMLGISVAGSALSVAVAAAALMFAHQLLPGIALSTALIAATAILPQALSVLAGVILRANGRLAIGTLAELGSIPALTITVLIVEATMAVPTLAAGVLALSVGSWLTAAWAVPVAVRSLGALPLDGSAPESSKSMADFLRSHFRPMASMMGTSLLFYVLTWAPQFVLAITRGPSDVAFFTVAARLAAFIGLVPSIQVAYLAPAFARLYHRAELSALNDLCNRSAWQAGLAAALPTLIVIAASHPLVSLLYGAGFSDAATPLVLLTVAGFLSVVVGQVNQLMLVCDLEGSALLLNLAWLAAWVTAGLSLSWVGGVVAASGFALGSGVLYAALAARLLAKTRGIYSFMRLRVPAIA